jgi:hypothetical protein
MLAWFVNAYNSFNALTPTSILVLFVVSVVALAWCLLTVFFYPCHPTTTRLIALVDVLLLGAFIAAVYYLSDIRNADCTSVSRSSSAWSGSALGFTVSGPGFDVSTDKGCAMLKASWAFGIMCCLVFPVSALAALHCGDEAYRRQHSRRASYSHRVYV